MMAAGSSTSLAAMNIPPALASMALDAAALDARRFLRKNSQGYPARPSNVSDHAHKAALRALACGAHNSL